ncbi:thiamine pyrophosphate-dependent enzyme, possible carboligase or decarboxylase [Halovivax ruber XH-70]|uniref:Thiamine pyrophosphate-dependent enzyme, possible carboligase or decarboxylase n=1 Tax=Halovivax ruber (strain DSM 18193 / JCM 13892 / XH-70) TaxID=797302 RepID=L0I9K6_HALRX|nr:thiamine pyrophosphate-binding protein [Halovivax ruber]AGB15508.1 thiamine pyrophosphate-dependent enzyme, possible carboligase or decarboxylase [Halovivax ruber XH-70]
MTRVTDRIVSLFERAGVETVFGFPCEQLDPYYASLADSDLRHVLARSEASAALMADGYARASGSLGIVDGVSGPGAAYLGAGLCEAAGASSPVLALTGGNDRETRGKGVIQDADNEAILDPFTKTTADAETPGRAVEAVEAAVREATGGVPGPAHVNLPEDVVRAATDREPRDDLDATFPSARPRPSAADVDAVLEKLSDADRPVILAGEGIVRADACAELSAFAERTNTPVVTSMNGKGAVAETAPYALGVVGRWGFCQVANDAVADADLVIGLGTRFGDLTTVGWSLVPDDAAVVHVDRDPAWLGRNYEADVPIEADLRATLDALVGAAGDAGRTDEAAVADRADRIDELAAARDAWRESHADEFESDASPITPQRVIAELNRTIPADGVLVSATSFPGFFSGAFYEPAEPGLRYLQARGSDGINACLPQAIGVQLARPDASVVALSGDGGIGYHIADLETAAREDLPLTVIVTNNDSLGSSKMSQMGSYNVDQSTDFEPGVDYAQVARGFGCAGTVIEDAAALPDAIESAIASDEPTLLDVQVDPYAAPPLLV